MSTILIFFLTMVLHPEVQRKAREEIDLVVGKERLLVINERESLPYIRSLVTEVFRWHSSVPLGILLFLWPIFFVANIY